MALTINLTGVEATSNKDTDGTLALNSDTKYPSQKAVKTYADTKQAALGYTAENTANKNATGGYAGLTLFKINFKNTLNTFTSFFTNSNTAARTYTFKDADGTIAFTSDITGTNSGTNTGDETAARIGALINGSSAATPNDADLVATAESSVLKKITWTNVKTFLKTYFDGIYQAILTAANVHTFADSLTAMTTPVDADRMIIVDNSVSLAKKITWSNIKATLKSYFDTIYATLASPTFTGTVTSPAIILSSETASTIASFDASKNIKSLDTATYPSLTELSYVKGVTSAIQTQINAKSDLGFTFQGGWLATNPADSLTYILNTWVVLTTGANNVPAFYIPKNCTLKAAYINIISTAPSNETVTYNVLVGGVATLIATNNNSTLTNYIVSNTSMSLACTAGQTLQLQIITPAWLTNPTGHRGAYTLYFE